MDGTFFYNGECLDHCPNTHMPNILSGLCIPCENGCLTCESKMNKI